MIVGQVVDGTSGRPVGHAAVTLSGPPSLGMQGQVGRPGVLTGSDGRFVFRGLPRGTYTIRSSKSGYADGAIGQARAGGSGQPIVVADGARVGDVVVRAWKFGAISGTVVDETGEPQVGIQIRAYRRRINNGYSKYADPVTAMTDDRGMYRFGGLLPGDYVVAATWPIGAVTTSLLTEMGRRGRPAEPALRVGDTWYPVGRGTATPPPPRDARLAIYPTTFHPGGQSIEQAMVLAVGSGEERTAADIQLRPVATASVSGAIVGPPMLGAPVLQLLPAEATAIALDQDAARIAASRSGEFTFPVVPEGAYTLRVVGIESFGDLDAERKRPELWANVPLTVGREDIAGLSVVMHPALSISGHAEFDGSRPRPSAAQLRQVPLIVERADPGTMATSSLSGTEGMITLAADGSFEGRGMPGGPFVLRVLNSPTGWMFKSATYAGRDISTSAFDLSSDIDGVVLTFTDRWTGVQGIVQGARGALDGEAAVLLFPAEASAWVAYGQSPRRLKMARAGANGAYTLNSLPVGEYYLVAIHERDAAEWRDPRRLEDLARIAERITVVDGSKIMKDLRTQPAPW